MAVATAAIFTGLALGEPRPAPRRTARAAGARVGPDRVPRDDRRFAARPERFDARAEMLALHAPEGLGLRIADEELEPAVV